VPSNYNGKYISARTDYEPARLLTDFGPAIFTSAESSIQGSNCWLTIRLLGRSAWLRWARW